MSRSAGDPKEADNALKFTMRRSAGDMFSIASFGAGDYNLMVDYLGEVIPGAVQVAGDFGGFVGISNGFPGSHRWLEGTVFCCGAEAANLVDDDNWRTYSVSCTAAYSFHIILEDFIGSAGIPGDAWFDNIKLTRVPEPWTVLLLGVGMLGLVRRRVVTR